MSVTGAPDSGATADERLAMDSRRDPRFTLLFRAAKLVAPSGEYLCILRDASVSGVRAQLFHALPPYQHFVLEMPNGDRHAIEAVWEHDGYAGFRFAQPIDLARLIGDSGPYPKRPVRLAVDVPVTVAGLGAPAPAMIRNFSQHGMRIDCAARFAIDQRVRIASELLPELNGRVRWRKDSAYGLVLDRTFRFEELAQLVWALHTIGGAEAEGRPAQDGEQVA